MFSSLQPTRRRKAGHQTKIFPGASPAVVEGMRKFSKLARLRREGRSFQWDINQKGHTNPGNQFNEIRSGDVNPQICRRRPTRPED